MINIDHFYRRFQQFSVVRRLVSRVVAATRALFEAVLQYRPSMVASGPSSEDPQSTPEQQSATDLTYRWYIGL